MATSKNQKPDTIDIKFHRRYKVHSDACGGQMMADLKRTAHGIYLDNYILRSRVLREYMKRSVCLTAVELERKLLYAELRRLAHNQPTILIKDIYYSSAG